MSRRARGLSPEERELWDRVAFSAKPMWPKRPPAAVNPIEPQTPRAPILRTPDFRMVERARSGTAKFEVATAGEISPTARPVRMDHRTHQQLTRGKLKPEARIDLHGMTLAEAHPELIRFVLRSHISGKRLILVITGKGKRGDDQGPIPQRVGVLRHQLPQWLSQAPLAGVILQVAPAHARHGGGGAFYVYLRKRG